VIEFLNWLASFIGWSVLILAGGVLTLLCIALISAWRRYR
jgi:hypothetical protein